MQRDYQSRKHQHTDADRGTNSQCQQQSQVQQTYSYYQPVPETIFQLLPQPHGLAPPPPPQSQIVISQTNPKTYANDFSSMN